MNKALSFGYVAVLSVQFRAAAAAGDEFVVDYVRAYDIEGMKTP